MKTKSLVLSAFALATLGLWGLAAPLHAQAETSAEDETASLQSEEPSAGFDATFSAEPQPSMASQMSEDEFIAFFSIISQNDEITSALKPAIEEMLQKGEKVDDWETIGIDILAELAEREGGLAGNLLRDLDREALALTDFSGSVRPTLQRFDSYALRPDPVGLVAERGFMSFLPGIWFEVALQREQRGTALCYGGYFGVTLHTRTDYRRWSNDQLIGIASLFSLIDQLSALETCSIYSRDKDGRFDTRTVLPDGTELPALNAESDPSVIMPASEIDAFLTTIPRPEFDD